MFALLYYAVLLSLISLGALAFWLRKGKPLLNQPSIDRVHRIVHQLMCEEAWERAYKELKTITDEDDSIETTLLHIELLRRLKEEELATTIALQANERFPHLLALKKELGKLFLMKDEMQQAAFWFRQAAAILRSEEDCLDYATALFACGQQYEAFKAIDCFLETSVNGRLIALAADYFFFIGQHERASFFYERALALDWSNRNLMLRFGLSFYALKKTRKAELIFRSILEKDSADVAATLALGQCFMRKYQYERALIIYKSGDAWDLQDSELLIQAGIAATLCGKSAFAEECFCQALKKGEGNLQTLTFFAYSLINQQKWSQAEEAYLYLIRKFPENAVGYRGISWLFSQSKAALISMEQGLLIARKSVMLYSDQLAWELLSACEAKVKDKGLTNKAEDEEHKKEEIGLLMAI